MTTTTNPETTVDMAPATITIEEPVTHVKQTIRVLKCEPLNANPEGWTHNATGLNNSLRTVTVPIEILSGTVVRVGTPQRTT